LCGLRWTDLHGGSLAVARNVVVARPDDAGAARPSSGHHRKGRWVVVKGLKVDRPRQLAIDADTELDLVVHRSAMDTRAAQFGMTLDPAAFIFSDDPDGGRPWYPPLMSETVQRIKARTGLAQRSFLHGLRRFAATEMLAAGIDPAVGAHRLGHASTQMFLDTYASATPARDQDAAEVLGALLRRPGQPHIPRT
jgi:integrase